MNRRKLLKTLAGLVPAVGLAPHLKGQVNPKVNPKVISEFQLRFKYYNSDKEIRQFLTPDKLMGYGRGWRLSFKPSAETQQILDSQQSWPPYEVKAEVSLIEVRNNKYKTEAILRAWGWTRDVDNYYRFYAILGDTEARDLFSRLDLGALSSISYYPASAPAKLLNLKDLT